MTRTYDVVVVGGGQAGLAIGYYLARQGRDFVILDGGRSVEVAGVVWATGYRPDYGFLEAPVLDAWGRPVHARGVTSVPGLYFLGLPWQSTRGSALLGRVGRDAAYLAERISDPAAGKVGSSIHAPSRPAPSGRG